VNEGEEETRTEEEGTNPALARYRELKAKKGIDTTEAGGTEILGRKRSKRG